jgi:SAM-dependent methyltransferase
LITQTKRGVVGYWDQIWQDHRRRQAWHHPHPVVRQTEPLFRKYGVHRILDLGAGVGRHSIFLSESGYSVIALDASTKGLTFIDTYARSRGRPIHPLQSGLDHLSFQSGSMDAVLCWDTLYHGIPEEVDQRLQEIGRILKPSGILQATMLSKDNGLYGKGDRIAPHTYVLGDNRDKAHPHFYCSRRELMELLKGYRILDIGHVDYGSYADAYHWLFLALKK